MTEEDYFDLLLSSVRASAELVAEKFDDPEDDWYPSLLYLDAEGRFGAVGLVGDKYAAREVVIPAVVEGKLCAAFVSGVYVLLAGTIEEGRRAMVEGIRDDPRRTEGVEVLVVTRDGREASWQRRAERDDRGILRLVGEWAESITVEGPMLDALRHIKEKP